MATKHMQATIGFIRAQIGRDIAEGRYPGWFVNGDGTKPSVEEMIANLDEMEADGFEMVPCGCQVDEKGRCLGVTRP